MRIDPTLSTPAQGLEAAVADRAEALAAVQASALPTDRVTLSPDAIAAGDAPPIGPAPTSTEQAIADAALASVAVEASAALMATEEERLSALMFVIAHHGPPLR